MFKTIRSKFIFLSSIIIIIFILVVNGSIYFQEREELLNITIETSLEKAKLHGEIVGNLIDKNITILSNIAQRKYVKAFDEEYIIGELQSLLECCDVYQSTVYFDKDGNVTNSHGEKSNIVDREYFQKLMEGNVDYVISKPLMGKLADKPLVAFFVPIRNSDDVIGGVGLSISLEIFAEIIEDVKFDGESYSWIVDKDGDVIIHPDKSLWLKRNIIENEKLGYDGFNKLSGEMLSSDMGYGYYYDKNISEKKVLAYSKIPGSDGWKLAITTLEKDVFSRVDDILNRVFITSMIFLLIFVFINYKLIDRITKPINNLTAVVSNRAMNDFNDLEIKETDDEIGNLIRAYNHMNRALNVHTKELENLVEKRTEELKEANTKLMKYNKALEIENINLYDSASKDELTGLFNRIELFKKLDEYHRNIERDLIKEYVVLFMDLDNFKYYNDTFGHGVGDQMLKYITDMLRTYIREGDFLARYGGDEFVLVIPHITYDNGLKIKDKLMTGISNMDSLVAKLILWTDSSKISIPDESKLGISIGVCHSSKKSTIKPVDMIRIADERMYKEKQMKKNLFI